MRALLLVGLALAAWACGRGGLVEAPSLPAGAKFAVLPVSEDGGADASERRGATGTLRAGDLFKGTSLCRRGPTTVVLRVLSLDGEEVNGTVEIGVTRGGGASGTYKVSGTYTPTNQRVKLDAGDWIDESDELEAADLEGTLGPAGLQARIATAGCSSFTMNREAAR